MQLEEIHEKVSAPPLIRLDGRAALRLRILHVVSHLGTGGTEHGVLKIINGLGHVKFAHEICVVRHADEAFVSRMNVDTNVSIVGHSKPGFQFPLFRMAKTMKRFRPDIVHTRNFGALEAIPAARLARVPTIVHSEHGYEVEILKGLPLRRRLLCNVFYSMADRVVMVSTDLANYHATQSWHSRKTFHVIHNGVDTDVFKPRQELAASLRLQFGIPTARTVIGCVGRVVPIKDHKTLLQAAELLIRNGKDIQLLIVGAGPELPGLKAQAAASPQLSERTIFFGASDRVSELLNAMDIFVLPSISEGMSNTILEAMATGLPLVASRVGGNPELVVEGCVGNLFDVGDVGSLADHLAHLVDDAKLRARYGQAARQRVLERFSLATMIERYRELYVGLASQSSHQRGN